MNAEHARCYLALGDSYTIGESVRASDCWPAQFTDALTHQGTSITSTDILAVTGWRTDQLLEAICKKKYNSSYLLVSLLIGVNNQYQGKSLDSYREDFRSLLLRAIYLASGRTSNVFVLSIPDYGSTPFGQDKKDQISAAVEKFNIVNKDITTEFDISYVDIVDISKRGLEQPNLVAGDGLHPSAQQYKLWTERIIASLPSTMFDI